MRQQQISSASHSFYLSLVSHNGLFLFLFTLLLFLGILLPWLGSPLFLFPNKLSSSSSSRFDWRDYSLAQAAKFVAQNGTVIVCAVSSPFLPFLNNWLISVSRQNHQNKVLVIAEDYGTLYKVNEKWPGHAVLIPPALESQTAHSFGSEGFFNFTARRPQHLLHILELGYNVMYNDVDMVWLKDPFEYLDGNHDAYFMDDVPKIKALNHSHDLPTPNRFKANDQPSFNLALTKTAHLVDLYLLSQTAFPTGGLYFKNKTWAEETKGQHVIIHNNYIVGYNKKMQRFQEYGLWFVDDHALESPLGKLM